MLRNLGDKLSFEDLCDMADRVASEARCARESIENFQRHHDWCMERLKFLEATLNAYHSGKFRTNGSLRLMREGQQESPGCQAEGQNESAASVSPEPNESTHCDSGEIVVRVSGDSDDCDQSLRDFFAKVARNPNF